MRRENETAGNYMRVLHSQNGDTTSSLRVQCLSSFVRTPGLNTRGKHRRFRALFGISSDLCAIVWQVIFPNLPVDARPVHLLWSLLFLKVYATESVNATIAGVDEKTFRKWSWKLIDILAEVQVIKWEGRYKGGLYGKCRISVDGTDCRILEPSPFDAKWFSHKFNGPGVRYEVGTCIGTGHFVWTHGPFACGEYSDVKIFRMGMKQCLDDGENVVADGGYGDDRCRTPNYNTGFTSLDATIRARHETANRRLKQFFALSHRFRHKFALHSRCFRAVSALIQLQIENGECLFDIDEC